MDEFYETSYTNVHRGVYALSERATAAYEGAREKARAFVNAPSTREIIFLRNATEALNLVAYSWGLNNLGPGDLVIVTELEHHSNYVPWQYMANRMGAEFRMLPLDDNGEVRLDALDEVSAGGNVKIVASNLVSNSLGTISDVATLAAWAHEQGAIYVCDAAQAAPHRRVDVQELGADFVAVSGHKMCGPSGIGFLWGKAELLERMEPFLMGGHMIRRSSTSRRPGASCRTSSRRDRPRPPRRSGSAPRSTTSRPSDWTRSPPTSTSWPRMRSSGWRRCRGSSCTARRPTTAPGSSASTSASSTRTTWRRSWTWTRSRSAPATTAASRSCASLA